MAEMIVRTKKSGSISIFVDGVLKIKLCGCGHSKNKPLCDSSHHEANFEGVESESRFLLE